MASLEAIYRTDNMGRKRGYDMPGIKLEAVGTWVVSWPWGCHRPVFRKQVRTWTLSWLTLRLFQNSWLKSVHVCINVMYLVSISEKSKLNKVKGVHLFPRRWGPQCQTSCFQIPAMLYITFDFKIYLFSWNRTGTECRWLQLRMKIWIKPIRQLTYRPVTVNSEANGAIMILVICSWKGV